MKDEEFNDLLQFHAESFELKPSSGSFDSVIRKYNRQKRHKLVVRMLPMAAAIAALPVAWFVFRQAPQTPSGDTAHHTEITAPAETKGLPHTGSQDVKDAENPRASGNTTNENAAGLENGAGSAAIPPANENDVLVAESPVNISSQSTADSASDNQEPALRGISSEERTPVLLAEQLPTIKIQPEKHIVEGALKEPQPVLVSIVQETDKNQKQAIRPESPRDKRCASSKFALSAFATPFIGGMFTGGGPSSGQAAEQKTAYNIGGQPVSYAIGNEKPLPSMAAGIKATFVLAPGWSLSAGLTYASMRMSRSVFTLVAEREPSNFVPTVNNTAVSYETRRKIAEDKYKVSYNYSSVPVQVAYSFKHDRWGIDLTAGASFNLLHGVNENPHINSSGNSIAVSSLNTSFDYRDVTVGLNAGTYVNYSLNNCTSIYAGPQISTGVQSVYRPVAEKPTTVPVTVGLETGVKIYF